LVAFFLTSAARFTSRFTMDTFAIVRFLAIRT
jgi:hypothetical protein